MKTKLCASIILLLLLYSFSACENQVDNSVEEAPLSERSDSSQSQNNIVKRCVFCDSVYRDFPLIVDSFEQKYSIGDYRSDTYADPAEDYINLFACLDDCYDQSVFERALRLGGNIRYEPDGPMLFQYELVNFSIRNDTSYIRTIRSLPVKDAIQTVDFFFKGLPKHDSFRPKLCNFLSTMFTADEYKELIRENYCND